MRFSWSMQTRISCLCVLLQISFYNQMFPENHLVLPKLNKSPARLLSTQVSLMFLASNDPFYLQFVVKIQYRTLLLVLLRFLF